MRLFKVRFTDDKGNWDILWTEALDAEDAVWNAIRRFPKAKGFVVQSVK